MRSLQPGSRRVFVVGCNVNFWLEIFDEVRGERGKPVFRRRSPSFSLLFSAGQLDQFLRNRPCRVPGIPCAAKLTRPRSAKHFRPMVSLRQAALQAKTVTALVCFNQPDQESGSTSAVIFALVAPPSGGVTPISTLRL